MAKDLTFEQVCRKKLIQGVKKLGEAVKTTLGLLSCVAWIHPRYGFSSSGKPSTSVYLTHDISGSLALSGSLIFDTCESSWHY